jgi:hypothetical protein
MQMQYSHASRAALNRASSNTASAAHASLYLSRAFSHLARATPAVARLQTRVDASSTCNRASASTASADRKAHITAQAPAAVLQADAAERLHAAAAARASASTHATKACSDALLAIADARAAAFVDRFCLWPRNLITVLDADKPECNCACATTCWHICFARTTANRACMLVHALAAYAPATQLARNALTLAALATCAASTATVACTSAAAKDALAFAAAAAWLADCL